MMDTEQTQQVQVGGPEATQMIGSPQATQMVMNVSCPVCKTDNPPGEQYCVDCGFLLSSTPAEVEAPVEVPGKLVEKSTGREFSLKIGENTVGRQNSDVLLIDGTVSRAHAKLTLSDGKLVVEDLGSNNGTFVNNQQVQQGEPVQAQSGAEIKFGSSVFTLELAETAAAEVAEEATEDTEAVGEPVDEAEADSPAPEVVEGSCEDAPIEEEAAPVIVCGKLVGLEDTTGEYQIVMGENTIGRRSENSIVISDPYTSGSHAVITADETGCRLSDVGSSNGTLVNGEALTPNQPVELHEGDEIVFGRPKFRFESVVSDASDQSDLSDEANQQPTTDNQQPQTEAQQ